MHPYVIALTDVLLSSGDAESFHTSIRALGQRVMEQFHPTVLKMRTKLYVSRADIRAYYVDHDELRHLVGSVLQTLLLCPTMTLRTRLVTEAWLPAKNKNILNKGIPGIRVEDSVLMAVGDLSSFTNNDVNSWTLLLLQLLSLEDEGCEMLLESFNVMVRGQFLSCCLKDVIVVYLMLTVGAVSLLPTGDPYVAMGGYLGVKANMTLTTMAFAVRLDLHSRNLMSDNRDLSILGQIGGDDYMYLIQGPNRRVVEQTQASFTAMIEQYVGQTKDPFETWVDLFAEDTHPSVRFCKKSLWFTTTLGRDDSVRDLLIQADYKLPFMGELITCMFYTTNRSVLNKLREFIVQVERFFQDYDDSEDWINAYVLSFCHLYDLPLMGRLYYTTRAVCADGLIMVDGAAMTRGAFRSLSTFQDIRNSDGELLTQTTDNRLGVLMSREIIHMHSTAPHSRSDKVFHKESEHNWYVGFRDFRQHHVTSTPDGLAILDAFMEIRTRLAHLIDDGSEVGDSDSSSGSEID